MYDLWRATTPDAVNISHNFSQREFTAALQHLKPGKAPGLDFIFPELMLHAGAALKSCLRDFLSSCLRRLKIPKIWRRALVVAIPKPAKPVGDSKSYRPIFLLCVPYKILERLIYARVEPLIDPLLPKEQAGFRRGKSTVDQVVLLTQNIKDSFEAKKKAGAVFVDLIANLNIFISATSIFSTCFFVTATVSSPVTDYFRYYSPSIPSCLYSLLYLPLTTTTFLHR